MKVVIIEDELPALKTLKKMLVNNYPDILIEAELSSLKDSENWFERHALPDLVFMDIELSDGLSLNLIEKMRITCPIIFITAYHEYWQEAFEYHSIDYLLKPLKQERLQGALSKYNEIREYFISHYRNLLNDHNDKNFFRDRMLVKRGKEFVNISTDEIAFLYATHKLVCLVDRTGSKFILDKSVSAIEQTLNPESFFRVNRKFLVHRNAISKITALPKSRLMLKLAPSAPEELIVSSESSAGFKKWLGGK